MKKKDTQVQEAQRIPNKMNPKRPTLRHVIIKMAKVEEKEKIVKAEKDCYYKEAPLRLSADFST